MTKQVFSRDEIKALFREAIQRKTEPIVEDIGTEQNQKTYTREEVIAFIKEDKKRTSKS